MLCNACGETSGTRMAPYFVLPRYIAIRCASCGLIWVSPMEPSLDEANDSDTCWAEYAVYSTGIERQMKRFRRQLEWIGRLREATIGSRLLDVGCGLGYLVKVALDYGFDAYGLDISPKAVYHARELVGDRRIYLGTLENMHVKEGELNLITAMNVIEHMENPSAFVQMCHRILSQGGILLMETPTSDGLLHQMNKRAYDISQGKVVWPSIGPRGHKYLFNARSMTLLLQRQGFKVLSIKGVMSPFFELMGKVSYIEKSWSGRTVRYIAYPPLWLLSLLLGMENRIAIVAEVT
jgi:2-polyprenyl-3-methyl-5-hydroxy-6-metoxy-1,4-benzoquinol methylase